MLKWLKNIFAISEDDGDIVFQAAPQAPAEVMPNVLSIKPIISKKKTSAKKKKPTPKKKKK